MFRDVVAVRSPAARLKLDRRLAKDLPAVRRRRRQKYTDDGEIWHVRVRCDWVRANRSSVLFQDGALPTPSYAGTSDALISESDPTINFGTANICGADGSDPGKSDLDLSTLLRWNITDIPPGTTVASASITLNVTNRSPQAYELYEVKRNWVETEATWDVYASGSNWEVGGAQGALDRGTSVLGTISASSTGSHTITLNVDGVAVVQSWVDDPGSNRGLITAGSGNTNGLDFDCREATTAANRPKLTVN